MTPLAILLSVATPIGQSDPSLRVLRATPQGSVEWVDEVRITFDRPVAASLGQSVDPHAVVSIEPPVEGALEWRDPVTIRLTPAAPLTPATEYRITIANTFRAMDGARLAEPFVFSFRVSGPRVLAGLPVGEHNQPPTPIARYIRPEEEFELLLTAPPPDELVELLAATAHLTFDRSCGPARIELGPTDLRRVQPEDDPWHFSRHSQYGPYSQRADRLRIMKLTPVTALPTDCRGTLVVPSTLDPSIDELYTWQFKTYGRFALSTAHCGGRRFCPTGPLMLTFTTPLRGSEVLAHVKVEPQVTFTVHDTTAENATWALEAELRPRTRYAVVVDPAITDIFGQPLDGERVRGMATTGYASAVSYPGGLWLIERQGPRSLKVEHVNVDTIETIVAPIPRAYEPKFLRRGWWNWRELWDSVAPGAARRAFPVEGELDRRYMTGVRMPIRDASRPDNPTLLAVRFDSPQLDTTSAGRRSGMPLSVVQVTDLAIHARLGFESAAAWVTGVNDGLPKPGVLVTLHDGEGRVRASGQTDANGLVVLDGFQMGRPGRYDQLEGYFAAIQDDDRALVGVGGYDPYLSPWRFNVRAAWGDQRKPRAAAVFTERDIYRPGESVYAKAIVRRGPLGELEPAADDSLRWRFRDRENGILRDTTVVLTSFGTSDAKLPLPTELPLGWYQVQIELKESGQWSAVGAARYRVAEYRPPEFLVEAVADVGDRFANDSVDVNVEARYLFGAAMGRAAVTWVVRDQPISAWALQIPDVEGYYLGTSGRWWEEPDYDTAVRTVASGLDTLDAAGHLTLSVAVPEPRGGRPSRTTVEATVTDINRQSVAAAAAVTVHPAAFYIGAKPAGERYFWRADEEQEIGLIAVRPDGSRVEGASIAGTVVRREWHRVRRERRGRIEYIGEWVSDTVATCTQVSASEPVPCRFTPRGGGSYFVDFTAMDNEGRQAVTGFYRWVVGEDWVPWYDENQLKMDIIADKSRYDVGDTATVFIASPFTDVDAWLTVEREEIIEQRKIRITSGSTTLRFPITEAHAPNAFVSVLVARGRSAPPGPPDDPGRPTIRVGYAELRVTPEVKRLTVDLQPLQDEYRPGDTARVEIDVRDSAGRGRRSEVTLWAVDEGVLALTGYTTPDPIDLIYRPRGLGMVLSSNLVAVAEQVAEERSAAKGEPGGGGGIDDSGILRSRFLATPFFLGSVITDANGKAVASAKLPDNLTTFRVMAVAVTEGDRYGSGESELLVTRPLLARPALPRFLREGDDFTAGVVVNHRLGGTPTVRVETEVENVRVIGEDSRSVTLEPGRGTEARFQYLGMAGADSATFRFGVSSGDDADAVQRKIAIRPSHHPRGHTAAGILWEQTEHATIVLPGDIDPDRSTFEISLGGSPLAFIQGVRRRLQVYPYDCSEQVASAALPIIALYRAQQTVDRPLLDGDPLAQIEQAVAILSRRQRVDGAIGFWTSDDWTSPWLSAHVGQVLLEARAAGVAVRDTVLDRLAAFLEASLRGDRQPRSPLIGWYRASSSLYLSDQVAAVDFLGQLGRPSIPAENRLLGRVAQMRWEDRVRLAEVVSRRDSETARRLLASAWAVVQVEGRRASLPDSIVDERYFYFRSSARAAARLFTATLAVEPSNALISPLLATLVSHGRTEERRYWTTQDYGAVVLALLRYEERLAESADRAARVASGARLLADLPAGRVEPAQTTTPLTGLVSDRDDGSKALRVSVATSEPGRPIYYHFTVREVPLEPPVRPGDAGIQVERWYELYDRPGEPIMEASEGDLVRVHLRITVPNERHFFVLDDPLPAGLEAVDISLRTEGHLEGADLYEREAEPEDPWWFGSWYYGYWSPFDHRELRDDRVIYAATVLWPGTYQASYVARATTSGTFARPPAHAEEMYNPAVNGRSDGGSFAVGANGR
ncbi:MAG: MG2 domain-containing protein [Gemmatimonadales bacterium]